MLTHINRVASRCCNSLLRWRTLKIYCRSWSVIPSKADCDCFILVLLIVVSAVESVENPVDASIIRWILEACVGVGGSRALRPLPIFLFKQTTTRKKYQSIFFFQWNSISVKVLNEWLLSMVIVKSCCIEKVKLEFTIRIDVYKQQTLKKMSILCIHQVLWSESIF